MAMKKYGELKPGNKIKVFGSIFSVKSIDLSEKGIKQGRTKCRVEATSEAGEEKTIIRLAGQPVEVL